MIAFSNLLSSLTIRLSSEAATNSDIDPADMVEDSKLFINGMRNKVLGIGSFLKENSVNIVWALITILIILLLSKLVLMLISYATGKGIQNSKAAPAGKQNKRMESILSLLRSASRYIVYLIALMMILYSVGLGKVVSGVLAGAGIGALAIGFGAQSLVKDLVAGLFLMFENQFSVGDFVKLDDAGAEGIVEATALRVTYIRALNGDQYIVPNGIIQTVVNKSSGNNQAVIDISTAYENDTRSVMNVIQRVLDRFEEEYGETHLTAPPILQGVNELGDSAVVIRVVCNCQELKQWDTERMIRLRVKEAFEAAGLKFPYPHLTVDEAPKNTPPQSGQEKPRPTAKKNSYYRSPWQSGKVSLEDDDA